MPNSEQQRWSYTRFRTYLDCPLQYKRRYLDREPDEPAPSFQRGRELHRLIHEYGDHCYRLGVPSDPAAARTIASQSEDASVQKEFLGFADRHSWSFDGLLGNDEAGRFETWHELDLGEAGVLCGRIDMLRIDDFAGQAIITDWKSGGWDYPLPPPECPLQLRLYALLVARELGSRVVSVEAGVEFVGTGVAWTYSLSEPDFVATKDWADLLIARVHRDSAFEPSPGQHCYLCGYRSNCGSAEVGPLSSADTETLVRELDVISARREAISEELRRRVRVHGPFVDSNGREWGWHESAPRYAVRDPVAYAELRRQAKLPPWGFVSWNQAALRRDWSRAPLREYLEELPPERRWGARKGDQSAE